MTANLPPHSLESEAAVLGSILINAETIEEIGFLEPPDFFLLKNQYIFDAMLDVRKDKIAIDFLSVTQKLEEKNRLSEVGGAGAIVSLHTATPSALNIEGYARIVQRMALRRKLIDAAGAIARVAHSEDTQIDDVIEKSFKEIEAVGDKRAASITSVISVEDIAIEVLAESARVQDNPKELMGMACGLRPLDDALGGFEAGLAYWFAGRPGMGKSALLAQIAAGLGMAGHGVLFFSLEMGRVPLVRRMICQHARISNTQCRRGRLNDTDLNKFKRAAVELRNVWVEARSGLTVRNMQTITRHYARQHDIKLVIIDTINRVGDVGKAANQYHGMTTTSHAIADWAHDSPYAIAVAAQLNRTNKMVKDPRPTLDSMRDSGSQEEDADVVIGIHRPGYYNPDDASLRHAAKLFLLKNREGDSESDVNLYWDSSWPGFAIPAGKVEDPPEIAAMKARDQKKATA